MTHISLVGFGIAGLLLLIMALVHFQKKHQRTLHAEQWNNDWDGADRFDQILGVEGEPVLDLTETVGEAKKCEARETVPDHLYKALGKKIFVLNLFPNRETPFVGYELLQSLLSTGLRFGEMNIFHRYEKALNGKDRTLFSVASATEPGTFDIDRMGATSCHGLSLFIQFSEDLQDVDSFAKMVETARQLSADLDAVVCDVQKNIISQEVLQCLPQALKEIRL